MIFRKNIYEIKEEYKNLEIKNEEVKIYEEINAAALDIEKRNEKIKEKYDKQAQNADDYQGKYDKAKRKLNKLKKAHPVLTKIAKIPLVGRFGKVAKEYKRLKAKMKIAKSKKKIAEKNAAILDKIYNEGIKTEKRKKRYLRKCEKSIRRLYKVDKDNIKIAKLLKYNKKTIEIIYGKSSLEYIENYVNQVKEGKKDIELPKGFADANELADKMKKDIKARQKGKNKEFEQIISKEEEESIEENYSSEQNESDEQNEQQNSNNNEKNNNECIFAQKGLDIKRDFVGYKKEIDGVKIKLTPEETLNYIGFITKKPKNLETHSIEEIITAIKNEKELNYANKGWYELHNMIEDLKDKDSHIDAEKLTESEKIVYSIAKKYIKKEEKAKAQKENEKDEQQAQIG